MELVLSVVVDSLDVDSELLEVVLELVLSLLLDDEVDSLLLDDDVDSLLLDEDVDSELVVEVELVVRLVD